jgi:hypothetical protein
MLCSIVGMIETCFQTLAKAQMSGVRMHE